MSSHETKTKLRDQICKLFPIDRIYLLGEQLRESHTRSVFIDGLHITTKVDHFYLLVIFPSKFERRHVIEEKIENSCASLIKVTTIVFDSSQFIDWMKTGHRFTHTVWQKAEIIYCSGALCQFDLNYLSNEIKQVDLQAIHTRGLNKVEEFLAGAELFKIRRQNCMAAFMLHQAAEHTLLTLLYRNTGFYITTHNLGRLARLCALTFPDVANLFERATEKEKRAINLLQHAYIDARYRDEFSVCGEDLQVMVELTENVKRLLEHH